MTLIVSLWLNGFRNDCSSSEARIWISNLVTRKAAFQENDHNGIYKFQQDLLPGCKQLALE